LTVHAEAFGTHSHLTWPDGGGALQQIDSIGAHSLALASDGTQVLVAGGFSSQGVGTLLLDSAGRTVRARQAVLGVGEACAASFDGLQYRVVARQSGTLRTFPVSRGGDAGAPVALGTVGALQCARGASVPGGLALVWPEATGWKGTTLLHDGGVAPFEVGLPFDAGVTDFSLAASGRGMHLLVAHGGLVWLGDVGTGAGHLIHSGAVGRGLALTALADAGLVATWVEGARVRVVPIGDGVGFLDQGSGADGGAAPDAGQPIEPETPPLELQVGCGCATAGWPALSVLAVAALRRRRRC
jgi:hypothetical protein